MPFAALRTPGPRWGRWGGCGFSFARHRCVRRDAAGKEVRIHAAIADASLCACPLAVPVARIAAIGRIGGPGTPVALAATGKTRCVRPENPRKQPAQRPRITPGRLRGGQTALAGQVSVRPAFAPTTKTAAAPPFFPTPSATLGGIARRKPRTQRPLDSRPTATANQNHHPEKSPKKYFLRPTKYPSSHVLCPPKKRMGLFFLSQSSREGWLSIPSESPWRTVFPRYFCSVYRAKQPFRFSKRNSFSGRYRLNNRHNQEKWNFLRSFSVFCRLPIFCGFLKGKVLVRGFAAFSNPPPFQGAIERLIP